MTVLSILEMISPIYRLARKPSGNIQAAHILDEDANDTYSTYTVTPKDEYIHGNIIDDTHGALFLKNYIDNEFAKMVTYDDCFAHRSEGMQSVGGYIPNYFYVYFSD